MAKCMLSTDLYSKSYEAYNHFKGSKYQPLLDDLMGKVDSGDEEGTVSILDKLPTIKDLMAELLDKLKGKSVYHTLEKVLDGKGDKATQLKGLSSLLTHVIIEIEHGNMEYRKLLFLVHSKISVLIYEV